MLVRQAEGVGHKGRGAEAKNNEARGGAAKRAVIRLDAENSKTHEAGGRDLD